MEIATRRRRTTAPSNIAENACSTGRVAFPVSRESPVPRGPERAAPDDLRHLRHLEVVKLVTDGTVEDPALVPAALPDHGDDRALDPPQVITREGGRRQNLVRGIDQHVILL